MCGPLRLFPASANAALPPDALIRRGLHRRFRLRLTSLVVTARADMAVREEDSPRPPIALPLLPWIDALASGADQPVNRDTDAARNLPVRLARALTGQFSDVVESWLASSLDQGHHRLGGTRPNRMAG